MNLRFRKPRWAATLMLGVIAASFFAPAAQASGAYGHYRRWKPARVTYVRPAPVRVGYYQHTSSAAPFIAGLIGGAILGTAISNSHASASCSYVDAYSGRSYGSLDGYLDDTRGCDHPQVVRVIESGRASRQMCWTRDGGWQDYRGGSSFSGGFSYRSGGQPYGGGGQPYGGGVQYRERDGRSWNDDRDRWNGGERRTKDDGRWNDRRDDGRWNDRRDDGDRRWKKDDGDQRLKDSRNRDDDRQWNDRGDDGDRQWKNDRDDDDDDNDEGDDR
jgi:hypothetical protein